jgi:hypothetical protein
MAEIWGAAIGAVVAGGAAVYGSRQAGRASQRGADAASAESGRQFDTIRGDTAGLRSIQGSSLDTLASLYGWAPPSQAQYTQDDGELVQSQGGVPAVDAQRYANDPAYRYAWDKTLEAERANPLWRRQDQQTFYAKATDQDWSRINELMARNLAEYRAQNPAQAPGASGRPNMNAFFESPDYQFNLEQGQQGIDRSLAARGRALSGAGVKEGARFASGMASREYGSFVDRLLAAAGLGTTGATLSANAGMAHAGNVGAAQINAGNNRASAYMAGAEGVNNAVQGGISNYLLSQYLKKPTSGGGSMDPYGYYGGGGVRLS